MIAMEAAEDAALSYCFTAIVARYLRWPLRPLAVLFDDIAYLLNMLPRMQRRPLGGMFALVKMFQRLECARGTCLLLSRLLLRRHVLPLRHHTRDAFVRVFLFLALSLDCFRFRFKFRLRGKAAAAQAMRDLDR